MATKLFELYEKIKFSQYSEDDEIDSLLMELKLLISLLHEPPDELVTLLFKTIGIIKYKVFSETKYSKMSQLRMTFDEYEDVLMKFYALNSEKQYEQDIKRLAEIYNSFINK
jgi:hypothetical protein